MKFNHLKQAIKKWERRETKCDSGISTPNVEMVSANAVEGERRAEGEAPRPVLRLLRPSKERVAGGTILWKPIDRAAAMLLAKSSWINQPPPDQPKQPNQKTERKKKRMSLSPKNMPGNRHPMQGEEIVYEKKTDEQFNAELSTQMIKRSAKAIDVSSELMDKALDARAAMDVMCAQWKVGWLDFQDTCDSRLKELRMTRMALDTEMRQLMASCREVRAFFLDKDYEQERARLKEFVDVCERLQRLKESGFLDSVADTMLKLADTSSGTP